jgi:hypothetical protein
LSLSEEPVDVVSAACSSEGKPHKQAPAKQAFLIKIRLLSICEYS